MSRVDRIVARFAIASLAVFMVALDNLVAMARLTIRRTLRAGRGQLEWTINAYPPACGRPTSRADAAIASA